MLLPVKPFTTETPSSFAAIAVFLCCPLADAFRIPVAVDVIRQDLGVTSIDVVADRLSDEVSGNGETLHAVGIEEVALGLAVGGVCLVDLTVVAPTGEFHTIVAKSLGLLDHGFTIEIGPLAGEKSDGTCHEYFELDGMDECVSE